MPTGSYEGGVDEGGGLGCSADEGGEDDICGGRSMRRPAGCEFIFSCYYTAWRTGTTVYDKQSSPIPSQLFQHLVQAGEMVVDRRSVLSATHRLQQKNLVRQKKPAVANNPYRRPHAVVQRLGRLGTRPGRRHVVLRCPTPEHSCQFRSTETDRGT